MRFGFHFCVLLVLVNAPVWANSTTIAVVSQGTNELEAVDGSLSDEPGQDGKHKLTFPHEGATWESQIDPEIVALFRQLNAEKGDRLFGFSDPDLPSRTSFFRALSPAFLLKDHSLDFGMVFVNVFWKTRTPNPSGRDVRRSDPRAETMFISSEYIDPENVLFLKDLSSQRFILGLGIISAVSVEITDVRMMHFDGLLTPIVRFQSASDNDLVIPPTYEAPLSLLARVPEHRYLNHNFAGVDAFDDLVDVSHLRCSAAFEKMADAQHPGSSIK